MPTKTFKYHLLALAVVGMMTASAWADDNDENTNTTHLGTLKVTTKKKAQQGKLGERTISRQQLNEENIQNAHDLVRYNTEVDVAEVGRYGNKGFAVRGVDGNRVAMNIDGVALPEVEVNEIFSPYGYMFEGRFNPDVEMMGGVRVAAGADSVVSGSGAVGGSVSYSTKEPYHLVRGDRTWGGYAKLGYTSKNEEKLASVGLAGIYSRAEFLLNYSRRDGHELKNHDMKGHKKEQLEIGYTYPLEYLPGRLKSLLYPQATKATQDSILAKAYYNINDNHRVGLHGIYQKKNTLMNTDINASYGLRTSIDSRRAKDEEKLTNYGINYQYRPTDSALDEFNLHHTKSKVSGLADTWLYDRPYLGNDFKFDGREYRPTNTESDQYGLNLKLLPYDLGKFGQHSLSFNASFIKADRKTSAIVFNAENKPAWIKPGGAFADVKRSNYNLSLIDLFTLNDRLKGMLGMRYDNYTYTPYFENAAAGFEGREFDENNANHTTCITNSAQSGFCDGIRSGKGMEKTKHSKLTWSGMADYAIIPNRLTTRYKIGTGFLAPTGTQIYRNFQGLGVLEVPNYTLKPETSLNQELELEFRPTKNTMLTLAGYTSKYNDFIHTKFWESNTDGCNGMAICLKSINLDTATVKGIKVGVEADLSEKLKTNGKFNVFANYHTAKDSAIVETDHNGRFKINTLAATPTSLILGADYVSTNNDWSVHGRIRGIGAKKAEDTKSIGVRPTYKETPVRWYFSQSECETDYYGDPRPGHRWDNTNNQCLRNQRDGYEEFVETYKHADKSKSVVIYDLYGTKKFGKDKQFILNGGIYNITDVKYIPWETLRMFSNANVNNMVDTQGYGFNRYTAPGRNFALSLTYEF